MTFLYILLGLGIIVGGYLLGTNFKYKRNTSINLASLGSGAPTLKFDEFPFRDLNKNGRLDPYEDSRLPIDERVEDLLSQMTIEEKAGMMFQTMIGMNKDGTLVEKNWWVLPHYKLQK